MKKIVLLLVCFVWGAAVFAQKKPIVSPSVNWQEPIVAANITKQITHTAPYQVSTPLPTRYFSLNQTLKANPNVDLFRGINAKEWAHILDRISLEDFHKVLDLVSQIGKKRQIDSVDFAYRAEQEGKNFVYVQLKGEDQVGILFDLTDMTIAFYRKHFKMTFLKGAPKIPLSVR